MELYTIPRVVIKISQSVARSGFIKRKLYSEIIIVAKTPPNRRAGSIMMLIIFYSSSRAIGSIRLTITNAIVIGIITNAVPKTKLLNKADNDGVINVLL
jgi:hypothetical protein